jgi:hypothetical protein
MQKDACHALCLPRDHGRKMRREAGDFPNKKLVIPDKDPSGD